MPVTRLANSSLVSQRQRLMRGYPKTKYPLVFDSQPSSGARASEDTGIMFSTSLDILRRELSRL
jgi:hypothetical protein